MLFKNKKIKQKRVSIQFVSFGFFISCMSDFIKRNFNIKKNKMLRIQEPKEGVILIYSCMFLLCMF